MKRLVCIALIGIMLLTMAGCGDPMATFESQVKSGDYQKAIETYANKLAGNSVSENTARSFLLDQLEEGLSAYAAGKTSETDFLNIQTTLEHLDGALNVNIAYELDSANDRYLNVNASKDNYARGIGYEADGNTADAIQTLALVVPEDTENYGAAQDKQEELIATYEAELIAAAQEYAAAGEYDTATACLDGGVGVIGLTPKFEACMREFQTQKYQEIIDDAYEAEDYSRLIAQYTMAQSQEMVTISAEMTRKYTESVDLYLEDIYTRAEEAFGENKDYGAAIAVLQDAIAHEVTFETGLDEPLEQRLAYYQEYIPVYLTSLSYTQKAEYIGVGRPEEDDARDVNGTWYDADTVIFPTGGELNSQYATSDEEAYVLYNLNMQYSTLSGVVYRPYSTLSCPGEWEKNTTVMIYGDDVLLYEAPSITQDTYDPLGFTIDVTGVRDLRIVMRGIWNEASEWYGLVNRHPKVCMAEVIVQK